LPDDTLEEALKKIATRDLNVVPVVADESGRKLVGILIKGDIYTAYNKKVLGKISKS